MASSKWNDSVCVGASEMLWAESKLFCFSRIECSFLRIDIAVSVVDSAQAFFGCTRCGHADADAVFVLSVWFLLCDVLWQCHRSGFGRHGDLLRNHLP